MIMTKETWENKLSELCSRYPIRCKKGANEKLLLDIEACIGPIPIDVSSLYSATNGLRYEWFIFLPIEDPESIKDTWDGIKRANNKLQSKYLNRDNSLLAKFLVVADIGGGYCACISRESGLIWFEDQDGLHETDLTLSDFIETSLKEVAEL